MSPTLDEARIRAVCFDLDGTLVETDDALVARLASLLRPWPFWLRGRDESIAARNLIMAAETPVNGLLAVIDRLGLDDLLVPVLDALHQARGLEPAETFMPIQGALETVDSLAQRFPLALVTAREARSTEVFLDTFQLRDVFGCIVTARTTRLGKPHPAPVLWAAGRLGLPPQACLMVGDTTADIRAGRAAGAQTVGVLCGFGQRRELERAGADLILDSVAGLQEILM
ncbi:MAG TPA: HAD family hydrolase [Anaerolineales bacterium]|nr:HAD family hydrolase [Anaerolineales bacterium]